MPAGTPWVLSSKPLDCGISWHRLGYAWWPHCSGPWRPEKRPSCRLRRPDFSLFRPLPGWCRLWPLGPWALSRFESSFWRCPDCGARIESGQSIWLLFAGLLFCSRRFLFWRKLLIKHKFLVLLLVVCFYNLSQNSCSQSEYRISIVLVPRLLKIQNSKNSTIYVNIPMHSKGGKDKNRIRYKYGQEIFGIVLNLWKILKNVFSGVSIPFAVKIFRQKFKFSPKRVEFLPNN